MPFCCWGLPAAVGDTRDSSRRCPSPTEPAFWKMYVWSSLDFSVPDRAVQMELCWGDLGARGYKSGTRFFILPGADYRQSEKEGGLSRHNLDRRRRLEEADVLESIPDRNDRARLRVGLDCPSPAIAAKILTGRHVGAATWAVRPVCTPPAKK